MSGISVPGNLCICLISLPTGSLLLFSAHGVSPEIRQVARERKLQTIDATCPLVTKVHLEAIRYARQNYNIILIGHDGHDEVIGTMGEAPEAIILVETDAEVDALLLLVRGQLRREQIAAGRPDHVTEAEDPH